MTPPPERCRDIAHLGHVDLLTDRFDDSLDFFTRVHGLKLSGQEGPSAYPRGWDDCEHATFRLTRSDRAGVAAITASEYRVLGWVEGDQSHGRAFRVADPFGHAFGIHCDATWYPPQNAADRPALKNAASAIDTFHTQGTPPIKES